VLTPAAASLAWNWPIPRRAQPHASREFLQRYGLILTGVAILGAWAIGGVELMPPSFISILLLTGLGIGIGVLALAANAWAIGGGRPWQSLAQPNPSMWRAAEGRIALLLISVALLEELLFRGYLVGATRWGANGPIRTAELIAITMLFALTHIYGGVREVLGKGGLAVLTLLATVASGYLWLPWWDTCSLTWQRRGRTARALSDATTRGPPCPLVEARRALRLEGIGAAQSGELKSRSTLNRPRP